MKKNKKVQKHLDISSTPLINQGYSWGGNTLLWEEESEELVEELEELRERAKE